MTRPRLTKRLLLSKEGWPYSAVGDRDAVGSITFGLHNWEAYRVVAAVITDVVLGWEIDRRLGSRGFNVLASVRKRIAELEQQLRQATFAEPSWGDGEYFFLRIRLLGLAVGYPKEVQSLMRTVRQFAPQVAEDVAKLSEVVAQLPLDSHTAASIMLFIKSSLSILDTIGVREAPQRLLRTRFTEEELSLLGLS